MYLENKNVLNWIDKQPEKARLFLEYYRMLPIEDRTYVCEHLKHFVHIGETLLLQKGYAPHEQLFLASQRDKIEIVYYEDTNSLGIYPDSIIMADKYRLNVHDTFIKFKNYSLSLFDSERSIGADYSLAWDSETVHVPISKMISAVDATARGEKSHWFDYLNFLDSVAGMRDLKNKLNSLTTNLAIPSDVCSMVELLRKAYLDLDYTDLKKESVEILTSIEINVLVGLGVNIGDEEKVTKCLFSKRIFAGTSFENDGTIDSVIKNATENINNPDCFGFGKYVRRAKLVSSFNEDVTLAKDETGAGFRDEVLIDEITKEKIRNIIENKGAAVIEEDEISFDIPEEILTAYRVLYAGKNPIRVAFSSNHEERHIIRINDLKNDKLTYDGVAFIMKKVPNKLYAINIRWGDEEKGSTLMEFSLDPNKAYKFVY